VEPAAAEEIAMSDSGLRFIETPVEDDRIIAYEIDGHFSVEDMRAFNDRIEAFAAAGKKARLYQDMTGSDGFDIEVVAEKLRNMGTIWRTVERIAVIDDSRWMEVYIGIVDHLTPQQMRHFSPDEKDAAFEWLTS